jgi:hypothetical protein
MRKMRERVVCTCMSTARGTPPVVRHTNTETIQAQFRSHTWDYNRAVTGWPSWTHTADRPSFSNLMYLPVLPTQCIIVNIMNLYVGNTIGQRSCRVRPFKFKKK